MIVVELTAAIDAAGTLKTFYLSTASFVTRATDTPAHTAFEPALEDPGSIGVSVFANGETGGESKIEVGEVIVKNADGAFDEWINYGFDGRPVVIRQGFKGAFPANFPAVFVGTAESVSTQGNKLIVKIKDKQRLFDEPILTNTYGGTNSLPNGIDGVPEDIKGQTKPKTFGKVFNVSPPCVNTSKLTFQVNDGAVNSIAVYDRGVALTASTNHANSAALQGATVGAGTFQTCLAEGLFRVGSAPSGTITADVEQGANAAARTAAQLLQALALAAGLTAPEISAADVTALDAANAAETGVYVTGDDTFSAAMDQLAASVGAWYCFDPTGVFRMARLVDPIGLTSVLTVQTYDILGRVERSSPRSSPIPAYRVVLNYKKIYTVQGTDIAGSVSAAQREVLKNEYRNVKAEDVTIKTQFKLAEVVSFSTLLVDATAAQAEADRRLGLFKVRRDLIELTIPSELAQSAGLRLGSCLTLVYDRFGLSGGKKLVTIGIRYKLAGSVPKAILKLWG